MTDYKVKRTPLLPPIPREDEFEKFDRLCQWRRGHLTVLEQLHRDIYDDVQSLANDVANANATAANATVHPAFNIFPWDMTANAGSWGFRIDANQILNGWYENTSNANQNNLTRTFYVPAGNYTINVLHSTGANRSHIRVRLDGTSVAYIDGYSAATVYNVTYAANFTVASSGFKDLVLIADAKNGNSSGYFCTVSQIGMWKYSG